MAQKIKPLSYFKATIIALILFTGQVSAQKITRDSLAKYTGIWMGLKFIDTNTTKPKLVSTLVWRIHRIDTLKNEIEITQTAQRFDDESAIEDPKKEIHKMVFEPSGFSVELDGGLPNSKYKLHLSHTEMKMDLKAMKAEFVRLDRKEKSITYVLAKISDDTSDFVNPVGEVEVIVQPPPPIK